MIYKKDANFPYPLLTNTSNSYDGCNFILDIELNENTYDYIIQIDYDIESDFIKNLIDQNKAQLVLIVQSKDNKFFNIKQGQRQIHIPKTRISFNKRTTVQLLIQAKEEVNLDVEVKQIIHEDSNFDKGKNTMFTRLVYICTLKNTNDYVIQLDPEEHSEYRLISSLDEMSDEKVVPFLIDILSNKNL